MKEPGCRWGFERRDLLRDHATRVYRQRVRAESFFETRLAMVNSPITWSRLSIWRSSFAIWRSWTPTPFRVPSARAASPAAKMSSRQRYGVASATP
jgi:hypothetical protein